MSARCGRRGWLEAAMAMSLALAYPCAMLAQDGGSCAKLMALRLNDTTIESAAPITVGTFNPPGSVSTIRRLPPFCRVIGVAKPAIGFEVWMPLDHWTGRFEVVGNGGM